MLIFILFFSLIVLYKNIQLLFKNTSFLYEIKNTDKLNINFTKISFYNISSYLNNKYITKKDYYIKSSNCSISNIILNKNNNKIINLYFTDFFRGSSYQNNQIKELIQILNLSFTVKIKPNNPDYLIYNIFGCNHLKEKYNHAIKIAYFTENQIPDFNEADYFIAHHHINYLDRGLKIPFFKGYFNSIIYTNFKIVRMKYLNYTKRKFCAAVISNVKYADGFRLRFINELDKYKKVDMGGHYKNNVGKIHNKILFLSSYKFSIAMENTEGDGYISEKIIESFLSGTIPIYYGDFMIDEFINPKSYILVRGDKDMKTKIDYIKEIDINGDLYQNLLNENIFKDLNFNAKIQKEKIEFFYNIFSQNIKIAKRVDYYHFK